MAFFERRISEAVTRGSTGGPVFKTDVAKTPGSRATDRKQEYPNHEYDIRYGIKNAAQLEEIISHFYNVYGRADGFRYKDWRDFQLTQAKSALQLISGADWQIGRIYVSGDRTFFRPIYKLCASPAPVIYRTRSGVISAASATVSITTGAASISGHIAGDAYTCVGQFDVPVAFADDSLAGIALQGRWNRILSELPSIKLEEIPV